MYLWWLDLLENLFIWCFMDVFSFVFIGCLVLLDIYISWLLAYISSYLCFLVLSLSIYSKKGESSHFIYLLVIARAHGHYENKIRGLHNMCGCKGQHCVRITLNNVLIGYPVFIIEVDKKMASWWWKNGTFNNL